jgi:hypothetical protein
VPDVNKDVIDNIRVNTEELTGIDVNEEVKVPPYLSRKRKTDSRFKEPSPVKPVTLKPAKTRKPTYKAAYNLQNEADTAFYISSPPYT